jgi:hypothetical protein
VLQDPTVPPFFRTFEQHPKPELRLGVRTHPQSRVESDQTCKEAAETIWLTYNAHVRECLHTGTVELSPPSLVESKES